MELKSLLALCFLAASAWGCQSEGGDAPVPEHFAQGLAPGVNTGLAAGYPNDVAIATNAHVLAAEDFESGQINIPTHDDCYRSNVAVRATGAFTGTYCGEHSWAQDYNGPSCKYWLPAAAHADARPAYFVRMYFKYDQSFHPGGDASAGVGVKGFGIYNEETSSNVNTPCDGTNWYGVSCQFVGWGPSQKPQANNKYLWVGHLYSYNAYPEEAVSTLGELLVSDPQTGDKPYRFSSYAAPFLYLQYGQWYCFEVGLYLNTPGKYDGEARFWIDGVLQSRVTHMRLRNVETHFPNYVALNLHRTTADFSQTMVRYVDNIVIANRYIGPVRVE